jgi:hypothetical protein
VRLSDDDFAALTLLHDFKSYYEQLSVEEMLDELARIYTTGSKLISLHQQLSMHERFVEIACFYQTLVEHQRSAIIGIVTNFRETLDKVIIPLVDAETAARVNAALAASDDYIDRFGYYPRAVEMIRVGQEIQLALMSLGR